MYIWPSGEVTGSVHLATLEAFHQALAAGDSLEPFAEYMPPGLDAEDYADYPLLPDPEPEAAEPAEDELPRGNASTEEWAAYGLSHGLTAEQVDAMSRDELRDHFTEEEV